MNILKLLKKEELTYIDWGDSELRVDFGKLYNNRSKVLKLAFSRFNNQRALNSFIKMINAWLPGYARYMAEKVSHCYKT